MSTFWFYDTLIINNYSYIHIIFPIIYQYQTFYYEKYDIVFYLYKLCFLHWQGRSIRPSRWFWSSLFLMSKRIDYSIEGRKMALWNVKFDYTIRGINKECVRLRSTQYNSWNI